ncbi:Hint domain-containing protein, partial [Paenibacillus massiliensis]|uniref:Hint domain-containing protein n=1 Tax=Paenibacillus massiliensis TaxID=225917 RepID=UPI001E29653F
MSQENPYSLEHFLRAGLIVIEVVPVGKGTGKVARLTEDGAEYVNSAINKALRSCNCFAAGTKVQTDEGEQNIEDIKVGDMVLAKDENNPDGDLAYKEVTALYRNQRDDIIKLHVGEQ